MDSQVLDGGYPQSLWISVWMTDRHSGLEPCRNVTLSNCSLFHQGISPCAINELRSPADISHVILSSTWGADDNGSRVCITPACAALRDRFSKKILWDRSHRKGPVEGTFRCPATHGFARHSAVRALRQEQLLQIVEEALAVRSRAPAPTRIVLEQTFALGCRDVVAESCERQAGA
jgi:hypothetical protein